MNIYDDNHSSYYNDIIYYILPINVKVLETRPDYMNAENS